MLAFDQKICTDCRITIRRSTGGAAVKYEFSYHRSFYTCVDCTRLLCVYTEDDATMLCSKKLGTLIVSRVKPSNQIHRRVQETGLGNASADYDDVVIHSAEKFTGNPSDCKGSGRFLGRDFCECKPKRGRTG
jgi:hypothetical protein